MLISPFMTFYCKRFLNFTSFLEQTSMRPDYVKIGERTRASLVVRYLRVLRHVCCLGNWKLNLLSYTREKIFSEAIFSDLIPFQCRIDLNICKAIRF